MVVVAVVELVEDDNDVMVDDVAEVDEVDEVERIVLVEELVLAEELDEVEEALEVDDELVDVVVVVDVAGWMASAIAPKSQSCTVPNDRVAPWVGAELILYWA